jgi:hypothetical protein
MFSGAGHASQHSGLLVAASTDGAHFRNIRAGSDPVFLPPTGVRDPIVLYWQGQWRLAYTYGPNVAPLLFLANSPDLLHWTPAGALRLAADSANNYVDVPQWILDPAGGVHLIACVDNSHHWVELHPLTPDSAAWGDPANWSAVTTLTDHGGRPLVQGNSFVALRRGTYFMAFNTMESTVYYLRTSASLTSGWSEARPLNLDNRVNHGDSENLVFLADGSLRFYISNGNALKKVIWYVDSADEGLTWTAPKTVEFAGFDPPGINWAQIVRLSDPAAIAAVAPGS